MPESFGKPNLLRSETTSSGTTMSSPANLLQFNTIGQIPLLKRFTTPDPAVQYRTGSPSPEPDIRTADNEKNGVNGSGTSLHPSRATLMQTLALPQIDQDVEMSESHDHDKEETKQRIDDGDPSHEIKVSTSATDILSAANMHSSPPEQDSPSFEATHQRQRLFMPATPTPAPESTQPRYSTGSPLFHQTPLLASSSHTDMKPLINPAPALPLSAPPADTQQPLVPPIVSSASSALATAQQAYHATHTTYTHFVQSLGTLDSTRAAFHHARAAMDAARLAFDAAQKAFDEAKDAWAAVEPRYEAAKAEVRAMDGRFAKAKQALEALARDKQDVEKAERERLERETAENARRAVERKRELQLRIEREEKARVEREEMERETRARLDREEQELLERFERDEERRRKRWEREEQDCRDRHEREDEEREKMEQLKQEMKEREIEERVEKRLVEKERLDRDRADAERLEREKIDRHKREAEAERVQRELEEQLRRARHEIEEAQANPPRWTLERERRTGAMPQVPRVTDAARDGSRQTANSLFPFQIHVPTGNQPGEDNEQHSRSFAEDFAELRRMERHVRAESEALPSVLGTRRSTLQEYDRHRAEAINAHAAARIRAARGEGPGPVVPQAGGILPSTTVSANTAPLPTVHANAAPSWSQRARGRSEIRTISGGVTLSRNTHESRRPQDDTGSSRVGGPTTSPSQQTLRLGSHLVPAHTGEGRQVLTGPAPHPVASVSEMTQSNHETASSVPEDLGTPTPMSMGSPPSADAPLGKPPSASSTRSMSISPIAAQRTVQPVSPDREVINAQIRSNLRHAVPVAGGGEAQRDPDSVGVPSGREAVAEKDERAGEVVAPKKEESIFDIKEEEKPFSPLHLQIPASVPLQQQQLATPHMAAVDTTARQDEGMPHVSEVPQHAPPANDPPSSRSSPPSSADPSTPRLPSLPPYPITIGRGTDGSKSSGEKSIPSSRNATPLIGGEGGWFGPGGALPDPIAPHVAPRERSLPDPVAVDTGALVSTVRPPLDVYASENAPRPRRPMDHWSPHSNSRDRRASPPRNSWTRDRYDASPPPSRHWSPGDRHVSLNRGRVGRGRGGYSPPPRPPPRAPPRPPLSPSPPPRSLLPSKRARENDEYVTDIRRRGRDWDEASLRTRDELGAQNPPERTNTLIRPDPPRPAPEYPNRWERDRVAVVNELTLVQRPMQDVRPELPRRHSPSPPHRETSGGARLVQPYPPVSGKQGYAPDGPQTLQSASRAYVPRAKPPPAPPSRAQHFAPVYEERGAFIDPPSISAPVDLASRLAPPDSLLDRILGPKPSTRGTGKKHTDRGRGGHFRGGRGAHRPSLQERMNEPPADFHQ